MNRTRQDRTLVAHDHSYIANGKHGSLTHSHEGGDTPHRHEDTGPAHFVGGFARAKRTVKPTGPQLPAIPRTPEENSFHVIFVDVYTGGHATAGITPERFAAERAQFLDYMAGNAGDYERISAEQRMIDTFLMTPIYSIVGGDGQGGGR